MNGAAPIMMVIVAEKAPWWDLLHRSEYRIIEMFCGCSFFPSWCNSTVEVDSLFSHFASASVCTYRIMSAKERGEIPAHPGQYHSISTSELHNK